MDNENKVHIWELPEKIDEIDKSKDYTIIHDGIALKKVSIEKLYDYFNQDYKIDNVVLFFETLMSNENERYEELYKQLGLSIESYDEIIKELKEKFIANRNKIRELESSTNEMDFDMEDISKSFERINQKHSNLSDDFKLLDTNTSFVDTTNASHNTSITDLNNSVEIINADKTAMKNNHEYISESVTTISEDIDTQVISKGEVLSKNINDAYDRIVSIIDYYHHIHDKEIN